MLCGIGDPDGQGLHHYELGLYSSWLFGLELVDYWLVCVLALIVHSVVNHKYLGHFVDDRLLHRDLVRACSASSTTSTVRRARRTFTYSDMNGFGHFLLRVASVRGVLGGCGAAARRRRLPVLGARHDDRLEDALRVVRAALHPAGRPRWPRRRRGDRGARRLHLLQHERAQSVRDDLRRSRRARPTTRRSTRRSPPTPQPKITGGRARRRPLSRASSACG